MGKFKDYGIMHFKIECDLFVAHKDLFVDASSFLMEAIHKEDCGIDIAIKNGWDKTQVFNAFIPSVKNDGYVVSRIGYWFYSESNEPHYEFVKTKGRGHIPVWYIDMDEVTKSLKDQGKLK